MENLIISNWIFNNQSLYDINLNDDFTSTLSKVENAILVGNENYGYYYLPNGFRFGFSDNKIDEIGIDFSQSKSTIFLSDEGNNFKLTNAKIHEVLNFLNDKLVKWEPVITNDSNYLTIKLQKTEIHLIFDIYSGTIDKIGKTNLKI